VEPLFILGNISFALLAASFLTKDILWLRSWCVMGYSGLATVNLLNDGPHSDVAFGWAVLFVLVHAVHIVILLRERRAVPFGDEEAELYETIFKPFAPFEFLKLLRLAEVEEVDAGTVLTEEGKPVDRIGLIYTGRASVRKNDKVLAVLKDGDFVGEISFDTGKPASADVRTDSLSRMYRWQVSDLKALLERNPGMRPTLLSVLHQDMARKLTDRRPSRVTFHPPAELSIHPPAKPSKD